MKNITKRAFDFLKLVKADHENWNEHFAWLLNNQAVGIYKNYTDFMLSKAAESIREGFDPKGVKYSGTINFSVLLDDPNKIDDLKVTVEIKTLLANGKPILNTSLNIADFFEPKLANTIKQYSILLIKGGSISGEPLIDKSFIKYIQFDHGYASFSIPLK
jgi:hypothetical protein